MKITASRRADILRLGVMRVVAGGFFGFFAIIRGAAMTYLVGHALTVVFVMTESSWLERVVSRFLIFFLKIVAPGAQSNFYGAGEVMSAFVLISIVVGVAGETIRKLGWYGRFRIGFWQALLVFSVSELYLAIKWKSFEVAVSWYVITILALVFYYGTLAIQESVQSFFRSLKNR